MVAVERCYHLGSLHPTDGRKTIRQMVARAAAGAKIGVYRGSGGKIEILPPLFPPPNWWKENHKTNGHKGSGRGENSCLPRFRGKNRDFTPSLPSIQLMIEGKPKYKWSQGQRQKWLSTEVHGGIWLASGAKIEILPPMFPPSN